MRWRQVAALAAMAVLVGVGGRPTPASAHPTDELLQLVYLTPATDTLTVEVDLTPGVLVAPSYVASLDTDGDGTLGAAELDALTTTVLGSLTVTVDGRPTPLAVAAPASTGGVSADLLAAGGGTLTLRFTAPLDGANEIVVSDRYAPARTTVQSSVLVAARDAAPIGSIERSDGGITTRVVLAPTVADGTRAAATTASSTTASSSGSSSKLFAALERPLSSPWTLLAVLGSAAVLGALHALTPGHGKTLLAAYLVGTRGTPRHALALAGVVTVTHTASVLLIGVTVLVAGQFVVPGVIVPSLELAAGALVVVLGARLVLRRLRRVDHDHHDHDHHDHGHAHDRGHAHGHGHAHDHGHAHGHDHGHGHHHEVPESISVRSLVTMGVSGGVVPCPEALGVLVLAVGVHRTTLGLGMIVAFSVGLAAVLLTIGLVLVRARGLIARAPRPGALVLRVLPLASAAIVTVLGIAMALRGVSALAAR